MNTRKVPETPLTCEVRAALEEYTQRLMNIYPERFIESDPEAWREEYRKKQEDGGKFEKMLYDDWCRGKWDFDEGNKEDYREVPQQPHAAERALWKAQREAGTNEVWQEKGLEGTHGWIDWHVDAEPAWDPECEYRVKPTKLTARICRVGKAYPMSCIGQDWEFTGTREEYRAECHNYGYAIVSEIKEVVEKPKTVKYYFAMYKMTIGNINTIYGLDKEWILDWTDRCGHTIIGNIEEREV